MPASPRVGPGWVLPAGVSAGLPAAGPPAPGLCPPEPRLSWTRFSLACLRQSRGSSRLASQWWSQRCPRCHLLRQVCLRVLLPTSPFLQACPCCAGCLVCAVGLADGSPPPVTAGGECRDFSHRVGQTGGWGPVDAEQLQAHELDVSAGPLFSGLAWLLSSRVPGARPHCALWW